MFKTRIKRTEFLSSIVLVALYGIAAVTMLLSAYGAVCVTYDLAVNPMMTYWDIFPHAETFAGVYISMNILVWIFSFVWGIVIYAHMTNKKYAWISAVATSAVGFITGIIPAIISDTEGFTAAFDIGSPNWGRTFVNLTILILLLIPPIKKGITTFTSGDNKWGGNIGRQLAMMSTFFFFLALWSFLGTQFMRDAHIIDGVNVWQTIAIQFYGGIATASIGAAMLTTGLIITHTRPPSALTTINK